MPRPPLIILLRRHAVSVQEKQYTFDLAYDSTKTNADVYEGTIAPLIQHALHGNNCTVFAYGATGSGKTFTMVGGASDPGLMVRSMEALFEAAKPLTEDDAVKLEVSYLEVYNEVRHQLRSKHKSAIRPGCVNL